MCCNCMLLFYVSIYFTYSASKKSLFRKKVHKPLHNSQKIITVKTQKYFFKMYPECLSSVEKP